MFCLLLLSSIFAISVGALETFEISDLLKGRRSEELIKSLGTTGLLAVKLPPSSREVPKTALQGLCACQDLLLDEDVSASTILEDGVTKRNTVATATVGTRPLPLSEKVAELCGSGTAEAMERTRDDVSMVSQAFMEALDRLVGKGSSSSDVLMSTKYGQTFASVSSIVHKANNLEHFHVYSKNETAPEASSALNMHTDAGLFLAFVPAANCRADGEQRDTSFFIQGQEDTPLEFPANTVAIMLGAGAEHWLQTSLELKATRHAVRMNHGDSRAWYGMMHLVPDAAIVQSFPRRTFGDMKDSMAQGSGTDDIAIGCGRTDMPEENRLHFAASRRRLQHVGAPSDCNNVTNFYCWLSCLDIPNAENAETFINNGYSLYCLDPSILSSSGNQVSQAVEPCLVQDHNSACQGSWQPTAPGVPSADVQVNVTLTDEPYCYGGTSMYMDGFHWWDSTCVIYLIPDWILDTQAKLIGASFGTIVFGIAVEVVIACRRQVVGRLSAGPKRLALSALFYGCQLTMGYLIMLVIMTYSGPLFMCVILGLMGGHVLFNAQDAVFKTTKKASFTAGEARKNDPEMPLEQEGSCCQKLQEEESCCRKNTDSDDDAGVPEGATPCCQNTL